jgi:hypothetical protein
MTTAAARHLVTTVLGKPFVRFFISHTSLSEQEPEICQTAFPNQPKEPFRGVPE